VVNIKKGQFLAPWDIKNAIEKAASTGNRNILVTDAAYRSDIIILSLLRNLAQGKDPLGRRRDEHR
jgi:3-deoxy-D-manno-octulosonic acid (KDO) 8-phosphate synthase